MNLCEEVQPDQVAPNVTCLQPGRRYTLSGDQILQFIHADNAGLHGGTTNEELLQVLIHRTKQLDSEFPCDENKEALTFLEAALITFEERSRRLSSPVTSNPSVSSN
jgi:hypothetical protein